MLKKSKDGRVHWHIWAASEATIQILERLDSYLERLSIKRIDMLEVLVRILDELDDIGALDKVVFERKKLVDVFSSKFKIRRELDKHFAELASLINEIEEEFNKEKNIINKARVVDLLTSALSRLSSLDKVSLDEVDTLIQQLHHDRMKVFKNTLPSYTIDERE